MKSDKQREKQRAEERVAIAQDALAWIDAEALIPRHGVYFNTIDVPAFYRNIDDLPDDTQLRDVVLGKCEVCAKGALLLSKAVRYDNVLAKRYLKMTGDVSALHDHFDEDQINLIEAVFEGWQHRFPSKLFSAFRCRYFHVKDLLKAILQNIIDNQGTFCLVSSSEEYRILQSEERDSVYTVRVNDAFKLQLTAYREIQRAKK